MLSLSSEAVGKQKASHLLSSNRKLNVDVEREEVGRVRVGVAEEKKKEVYLKYHHNHRCAYISFISFFLT